MNSTTSPKKKSRSSKARKPSAARRELRQWLACRRTAAYPLSRLECETPILSDLVAEGVCAAAANWLGDNRPMRFAPALAARARRIYEVNASFAARLRRDDGIEWLRVFLRHWLAGRLRRECRDLFDRLPPEFANGASLPPPEARARFEITAVCRRAAEPVERPGFHHAAAAGADMAYCLL